MYDLESGRILSDHAEPWRSVELSPARGSTEKSVGWQYGEVRWSPDGQRVAASILERSEVTSLAIWGLGREGAPRKSVAVSGPERTFAGWWADGRLVMATGSASDVDEVRRMLHGRATPSNRPGRLTLIDPETGAAESLYATRRLW